MANFLYYVEAQEKEGGAYWEFLKMDDDQLYETIGLDDVRVSEIISEIQNPQLKQKMKERMYQYVKHTGINRFIGSGIKDLLTQEQAIDCMRAQTRYYCNLIDNEETGGSRQLKINDVESFISYLMSSKIDDNERIELIDSLITQFNKMNYPDIEHINEQLIHACRGNSIVFDELIQKYANIITPYYFKYLEIGKDPEYILRKAEQFYEDKIQIGIDPRISLGLEIEANHRIGHGANIRNQKGYEYYREHDEATVSLGTEIVCPPIHDKPEELSKICALLETMAEEGFYYDEKSGNAAGQINIGLDYLNSAKAVMNFYEIFGNCEELLFHICNVKGQLIRQQIYRNSRFKPISEIIGTRVVDEDISRIDLLKLLYPPFNPRENDKVIPGLTYKKNTVGVRDLFSSKARLEIRIPNGSTDYHVWIDNMRLFGKIVEVSRKLAEIQEKDDITPEEEHLLWLKESLSDPNSSLEDKLYDLMDLLFEDDEIKNIYVDRFYTLEEKIKETRTQKYEYPRVVKHLYDEKSFGTVDFQQQYRSLIEKGRVISFDPETGIYREDGEEEKI